MTPFGPYDQFRKVLVSSRMERVRDLDVRIDTVRYERFLGRPGCETILSSNDFYTVHITRNGKYPRILWNGEAATSCGPLSHARSAYELLAELRALPPEAIR